MYLVHLPRFVLTILFITFASLLFGVESKSTETGSVNFLHDWDSLMIDVITLDGINPVLGTRMYAYPFLAAYLAVSMGENDLPAVQKRIKALKKFIGAKKPAMLSDELAAITALYKTAKVLLFREAPLNALYTLQSQFYREKLDTATFRLSVEYGDQLAKAVLAYAGEDNFTKIKSQPAYFFPESDTFWRPSPPEFRDALEPYWGTVRPFFISKSEKFILPPSNAFSTDTGSAFYREAKYVYDLSAGLNSEQKEIALFWDDNPDLNLIRGHSMKPRRHISPVSHWMNIVRQICIQEKFGFDKSLMLYMLTSLGMADTKILCWDMKYRYNTVRPAGYIRKYIDPNWMPFIVTPPFPEYPSGHSMCSAYCSTLLSHFVGENYTFTDMTHTRSGLPSRTFTSFDRLAEEVSMSRIYGGIHFMEATEKGRKQGILIARYVIKKLKL